MALNLTGEVMTQTQNEAVKGAKWERGCTEYCESPENRFAGEMASLLRPEGEEE